MSDESLTDAQRSSMPVPRAGSLRTGVRQHPRVIDAMRRQELRATLATVRAQVDEASAIGLTPTAKIDKLLAVNTTVIMSLLTEALADAPDVERSMVYGRALTAVKDTVAIIAKQHEMSNVDSFNPRSPKFAVAFGWFLELVHRVASRHSDETPVANMFNELVSELAGWEDRLERQFKGVSGANLGNLQSPFAEDIRERIRQRTIEVSVEEQELAPRAQR